MKFIIVLISLLVFIHPTFADDVYVIIAKKQEAKKNSRWTLGDWLLTKQKMSIMDQWLALHSSSNDFEFYLGGDSGKYNLTDNLSTEKNKYKLSHGQFGAYFRIFGLEGNYEKANEKYTSSDALFALRIFGRTVQGTNLTLHYGLRNLKTNDSEKFQNQFWGGSFTLYLLPFLGGSAMHRVYRAGKSSLDTWNEGSLTEFEGFLDISFLRLYATQFKEIQDIQGPSKDSRETRKGTRLGAKLFF